MKTYLSWVILLSASSLLPAQTVPARIGIVVVEGEGATHGARQRVATDPTVKVEDDDHRPVAGAAVVFALPVSGASGEFLNGTKTLSVITNQEGLAAASGLRTNDIAGKLQIYVTATYRGLRARTLINQLIEAAPGAKSKNPELRSKSGGSWKWVVLGIIAAGGAGAGVYYGTHNSGSSSASSATSISAGTVVFGSPR